MSHYESTPIMRISDSALIAPCITPDACPLRLSNVPDRVTLQFHYIDYIAPRRTVRPIFSDGGSSRLSHFVMDGKIQYANPHDMADAPQLAYDQSPPLAHSHVEPKRDMVIGETHRYWDDSPSSAPQVVPPTPQHRTILGLRRRNFVLLFGIILVIAIATIGGSIGGSLTVRNSKYVLVFTIRWRSCLFCSTGAIPSQHQRNPQLSPHLQRKYPHPHPTHYRKAQPHPHPLFPPRHRPHSLSRPTPDKSPCSTKHTPAVSETGTANSTPPPSAKTLRTTTSPASSHTRCNNASMHAAP
jgi:hypothetical protein